MTIVAIVGRSHFLNIELWFDSRTKYEFGLLIHLGTSYPKPECRLGHRNRLSLTKKRACARANYILQQPRSEKMEPIYATK
jgi:hypothetical protein